MKPVFAKEFKSRVTSKVRMLDESVKPIDLFFTQYKDGYTLSYQPLYPEESKKDFEVYYFDNDGGIAVLGKADSIFPGRNHFCNLDEFMKTRHFDK